MLIDKDDLWVLLWYGLPCLTIDEEELGRVFVDGELLQLDRQRELHEALIVGGAPLGHVGGGLELHTLHIGTAECRSDDGDEEPDVGEQRRDLSQAEV